MAEQQTSPLASADQGRSNSPFRQPIAPARIAEDLRTATENATVIRPAERSPAALLEARRVAEQSPQDRFRENQERSHPQDSRERLGDRKLSDAEYDGLSMAERSEYAQRYTELHKDGDTGDRKPGEQAADPVAKDGVKLGDRVYTADELRGLEERAALEASRKLTLPESPDKYIAKLPDDFQLPPGIEYSFNEKDPMLQQVKAWAHRNGFSQQQLEGMLSFAAAREVGMAQNIKIARDAEISKLGALASQRVTSVQQFLRSQLGDGPEFKILDQLIVNASVVRGWERLMQNFARQGAGTINGGSREPSEFARMSDEDYGKLSYGEKMEYARNFPQAAANGSARR